MKIAKVTAILKGSDSADLSSYQPISVVPGFFKNF